MWFVLLHRRHLIRYGHIFLHDVFPSLILHLLFASLKHPEYRLANPSIRRSRQPRFLRHSSAAARLLGSRVLIPLRALMFVSFVGCMLCRQRPLRRADPPSRGVLPVVYVCDSETSTMTPSRPELGCCCTGKKQIFQFYSRRSSNICVLFKSFQTYLGAHQVF